MSKTSLRVSLLGSCLLGLAVCASGAEARGFGGFHGGFHGHHGHWHHHGWGHGFGWRGVGLYDDGCYDRRFIDAYGRIVVRRVCE